MFPSTFDLSADPTVRTEQTNGSALPAPRSPIKEVTEHPLRGATVLIVDPDRATREPLAASLAHVGVGDVVQVSGSDALDDYLRLHPAGDLALVSLSMSGESSRIVTRLRAGGWTRVVALAPTADIGPVIDAVGAGVSGVLIGRRANPAAISLPSSIHELSSREIEVIRLVADGRSNKWIGDQLTLSALTVKSHLARIGRKLGTGDRAHMVALAMRAGIIS